MKKCVFSVLSLFVSVEGHAYMTEPLPRMYRDEGVGLGWTKWYAIAGEDLAPGEGNAANMNAAIPNGQSGIALESTRGHGLCGDRGDRRAFMKGGPYGPTSFRSGSYQSGGLLPVQISVKAYHAGWFEFRLCDVSTTADGEVTQECLNEHVLKVDSSTPFYPTILDYANMKGRNPNGDGGVYKCKNSGGYADPTATSDNSYWPNGSCCQNGGECSDPLQNDDRYVIEYAAGGNGLYDVVLQIPEDIACEHCVLQFYYQTANAWGNYPEAFWNCADITINSDPTQPTPNQPAPSPRPTIPPSVVAPSSVPVSSPGPVTGAVDNTGFAEEHGRLKLDGVQLVDSHGTPVQLMGMSSHGLHWFPECYSKASIEFLVKNWGINVFRAAMYIGENGYATDPSVKQQVKDVVQWCKELGIYVMIDWHVLTPGDPNAYLNLATEFWQEMATLFKDEDHLLYEIANEPNGVSWETVKRYHDTVIPVIRAIDPHTIIIAGTPTWSQDIHEAAARPVAMQYNVMYAFHFYAGTHMFLLNRVREYITKIPIFVTEWGTSEASGDNGPYLDNTQAFLDAFKNDPSGIVLSWAQWSYADKNEVSAALLPDSCRLGNWDATSTSGTFVRDYIKANVQTTSSTGESTTTPRPTTNPPTTTATNPITTPPPTVRPIRPTNNPTNRPTTTSPSTSSGGCTAPVYQSGTIYNTGDVVRFEGVEYTALWWTKGDMPPAGLPWEWTRTCDEVTEAEAAPCGGVQSWQEDLVFRKGREAVYDNKVYRAKWWSQQTPPPEAQSWELVRSC